MKIYNTGLGQVPKAGNRLPHELSGRQFETRKTICELLLERCDRKLFLYRIVTGDKKWIYYDSPKRHKVWVLPSESDPSMPSDYHLFRAIRNDLSSHHFKS